MTKEQQAYQIMKKALEEVENLGLEAAWPSGGILYEFDDPIFVEGITFEPLKKK